MLGSPRQQAPGLDEPTSLIPWGWLSVSSADVRGTIPSFFMKQLLVVSLVLLWHVVI